jgi:hypothetical protein
MDIDMTSLTSIGEARRRITRLDTVCEEWRAAMNELVREYNAEFSDPPVTLRIHSQHWNFALRWRRRGKGSRALGQSAFLMTSEIGRRVIEGLPKQAARRVLDYDRRAMHMNLNASIASYTQDRLRLYLRRVEKLEALQSEFGV